MRTEVPEQVITDLPVWLFWLLLLGFTLWGLWRYYKWLRQVPAGRWFVNYYHCQTCDESWEDEWDCTCDDTCPSCGVPHTPWQSVDTHTDGEDVA